jgi:hypothetical protein
MSNGPPPRPPTPAEVEHQKWLHEQSQRVADRAHDKSRELLNQANQAAIEIGNLALRNALLINGGAAIALLAFIRDLPPDQRQAVANTLVWFASGVAAAVAAFAFAYFTNFYAARVEGSKKWNAQPPYVEDGPTTKHQTIMKGTFHTLSVITGVGSLALFIVGMLDVRAALAFS